MWFEARLRAILRKNYNYEQGIIVSYFPEGNKVPQDKSAKITLLVSSVNNGKAQDILSDYDVLCIMQYITIKF